MSTVTELVEAPPAAPSSTDLAIQPEVRLLVELLHEAFGSKWSVNSERYFRQEMGGTHNLLIDVVLPIEEHVEAARKATEIQVRMLAEHDSWVTLFILAPEIDE